MRKLLLGRVETVTKAGYATVKIEDPNISVKLGLRVVDASGSEVGRRVDVIGRVEEPYAVVRVNRDDDLVGRQVYVVLPPPRRRRGRGRKGKGGRRGGRGTAGVRSERRGGRPGKRSKNMRDDRRGNRRVPTRRGG